MRRQILFSLATALLTGLTLACSDGPVDPPALDPHLLPAFHVTDEFHLDGVKIGNPFPGEELVWVIAHGFNTTASSKGETIEMGGEGPFSTQPHGTVGGGGTFTWRDANGNEVASGEWAATRFISYTTYREEIFIPESSGGPLTLLGGLLIMEVELDTGHTGVLRIDCLIGQPPPAAREGIELALRKGPNFQREIRGATVYLRFPT